MSIKGKASNRQKIVTANDSSIAKRKSTDNYRQDVDLNAVTEILNSTQTALHQNNYRLSRSDSFFRVERADQQNRIKIRMAFVAADLLSARKDIAFLNLAQLPVVKKLTDFSLSCRGVFVKCTVTNRGPATSRCRRRYRGGREFLTSALLFQLRLLLAFRLRCNEVTMLKLTKPMPVVLVILCR